MNDLNNITILDILSFYIGIKNLGMNISQNDLQNQTTDLDKKFSDKMEVALKEIHEHLERQDKKIDYLINLLKGDKGK